MQALQSRPASNLDQSAQTDAGTEAGCIQTWSDGSVYKGLFKDGKRHGHGEERWPNGEVYVGEFVNDKKEGKGTYSWPDGSKFIGNFKSDKRSGFGRHEYRNGSFFEGVYQNDIRDGPGVFTYAERRSQDVGIWFKEKIHRICTRLRGSFTYKQISHHAINAVLGQSTSLRDIQSKEKHPDEQLQLWKADSVVTDTIPERFNYKDLVHSVRTSFKPKGHLEELSEKFIKAAIEGDVSSITEILRDGAIHPDVTDSIGFSAMLAAAVNCHADVINCLLDFGANVNILNTEGLSPLGACYVLLYTKYDFIENIAESIPKENTFNSMEWDKQRGSMLHRNDRKAILSMFGVPRSQSQDHIKQKNGRAMSARSNRDSPMNGDTVELGTPPEEDERNQELLPENWKLSYFQRTLSRGEKLDAISRNFSKLKGKPFDFENTDEDIEPLSVLAAEKFAKEAHEKDRVAEKCSLSEASVYCGEDSFGTAPKIESLGEDSKLRLLIAERKPHLKATISLLLERGADPNASTLPMPVLFFAVKAADIKACEALLSKGASASIRLNSKDLGLTPLHIAVALPCRESIEITRLLLEAKPNPDLEDMAFGESSNGRTALHIACIREDDNKIAQKVASCLLHYNANPNLLCQGYSPLSLAIASGNDLIVEALLKGGADPSLKLSNGVGSALCSATIFTSERRRQPLDRIKLVDKLVKAGADLLAPIQVLDKSPPGTVVDYAHHVFNQDRRIAHTPYHALNALERACHNARKDVLEHLGHLLRTAALKREKQMIEAELKAIAKSDARQAEETDALSQIETANSGKESPTRGSPVRETSNVDPQNKSSTRDPACGLPFAVVKLNDLKSITALGLNAANQRRLEAKKRFRYCYECGRSMGLRLTACTRCKEVFFCSKVCKVKAWNVRHREECARITGRISASNGRGKSKTMDSPKPGKEAEEGSSKHGGRKTTDIGSAKSFKSETPNKSILLSPDTTSARSPCSSNNRSPKARISENVVIDTTNSKHLRSSVVHS